MLKRIFVDLSLLHRIANSGRARSKSAKNIVTRSAKSRKAHKRLRNAIQQKSGSGHVHKHELWGGIEATTKRHPSRSEISAVVRSPHATHVTKRPTQKDCTRLEGRARNQAKQVSVGIPLPGANESLLVRSGFPGYG